MAVGEPLNTNDMLRAFHKSIDFQLDDMWESFPTFHSSLIFSAECVDVRVRLLEVKSDKWNLLFGVMLKASCDEGKGRQEFQWGKLGNRTKS